MEENLFEIKLTSDGKDSLNLINRLGKFLFTCSVVTGILDLIQGFLSYRALNAFSAKSPEVLNVQTIISIIFISLYAIVIPFHGY